MHSHTSTKLARTLLAAGAVLAACSEAPNPAAPASEPLRPNFVLGANEGSTAELGKLKVCKTGNVDGTFTISPASASTVTSPFTVVSGTCKTVAEISTLAGADLTITETSAGLVSITGARIDDPGGPSVDNPANGPVTRFLNGFHGYRFTFDNFVAPPAICTYTKGWYQNKNGAPTIVETIDGRTPDQQRAIFEASPGQPGNVTWGTNNKPNNLLNLYQQFLAAMNNLGGDSDEDAGPDAVDDAIDAVQAGTGGTGLNITTTLTGTQISALIDVLSAFNEGRFRGFPHCDDEVLAD